MKKALIVVIVLVLVGAAGAWFFLFRNGNNSALVALVPKQANMIMTIDLVSLSGKADWKAVSNSAWMKEIKESGENKEQSKLLSEIMSDPTSTGLKLTDNPVFFMTQNTMNPQMGVIFSLGDATAFETMVKKLSTETEIKKKDKLSYTLSEDDDPVVMIWNDKNALFYYGEKKSTALEIADSILTGKMPSLIKDVKVKDFGKRKADISILARSGATDEMLKKLVGDQFADMPYQEMFVDFENGKVVAESQYIYENDEQKEKWTFLGNEKGKEVYASLGATNPILGATFNFNMEKFFNFLMGIKDFADGMGNAAEELGVQRAELKKLLGGQISLVFNGVKNEVITGEFMGQTYSTTQAVVDFGGYLSINDQDLLNKIMAKSGLQPNADGFYEIPLGVSPLYLVKTSHGLYISTKRDVVANLSKGVKPAAQLSELASWSEESANTFFGQLSLDKMSPDQRGYFTGLMGKDSTDFLRILKPLDRITMKMEEDNIGRYEMLFSDKNTNALQQTVVMLGELVAKINNQPEMDFSVPEEGMEPEMEVEEMIIED